MKNISSWTHCSLKYNPREQAVIFPEVKSTHKIQINRVRCTWLYLDVHEYLTASFPSWYSVSCSAVSCRLFLHELWPAYRCLLERCIPTAWCFHHHVMCSCLHGAFPPHTELCMSDKDTLWTLQTITPFPLLCQLHSFIKLPFTIGFLLTIHKVTSIGCEMHNLSLLSAPAHVSSRYSCENVDLISYPLNR